MAQVVASREASPSSWRFPRPNLRVNRTVLGVVLLLGAWLLQQYCSAISQSRAEVYRLIESAYLQREMWMIEYNASLIRTPRSERVTARAAFQVVENTRELLALSDIATGSIFMGRAGIIEAAHKDVNNAHELFNARNYPELIAELNSVNQAFEKRVEEHGVPSAFDRCGVAWWQHLFPAAFLLGVFLCYTDARRRREV